MSMKSGLRRRVKSSNQKFWHAHVAACHKSGLTRAEYCRQHNISHHQLRYWHLKQEQSDQEPVQSEITFAPVPLRVAEKDNRPVGWTSFLRVGVGDRFKIEVADEFSPVILVKLIRTLENC